MFLDSQSVSIPDGERRSELRGRPDIRNIDTRWVSQWLAQLGKFESVPFARFSRLEEPQIFGYAVNGYCSLCTGSIAKGFNDNKGTITRIFLRIKDDKVEEVQVVLCTFCLMGMKLEGEGE